ncbi:MAG: S-adenosylmethionine decarboxylase [Oligoflexales bacterium]|nr:S-adenosylmethionine decarboxylase [Oligoflexales bacterium]
MEERSGSLLRRLVPRGKTVHMEGFNNLTKSLNFNLYDFCVARNDFERGTYIDYVQKRYNAAKITRILKNICEIIEAKVLAVSDHDYDPWGASSLILMGEERKMNGAFLHLDKSHICAHTYPDFRAKGMVCSFRTDIEISTCGEISPLKALNYMFDAFDSDVVIIDYKVRGFTRDHEDRRIYLDHAMAGISSYINPKVLLDYQHTDLNLESENIWQTKLRRTNMNEASYFLDPASVTGEEAKFYLEAVSREMKGVIHMLSD